MWVFILAIAAPPQTTYLGPVVNVTLTDAACSPPVPLTSPTATLHREVHGVESVALNNCTNGNITGERWQTENAPKVACSCREDYPAFTVLPGRPTKNYCSSFEAGYGWLYGEQDPSLRLDWMTVFPQNNVTINVSLPGITFKDPIDDEVKTCTGQTIIQKSNMCFYGRDFNETLIPVNKVVLDTLTGRCNGTITPKPLSVTPDCCVNATINDVNGTYVSRDIFFAAACNSVATSAVNNADGRFHSGEEQSWTADYFLTASLDDITRNITNLFKPGYKEGSVRKNAQESGYNGICRRGTATPTTRTVKTLRSKAPTPEQNTRTELHTTCIVPQFLIDETLTASVQNPFQNNISLVKRWALHMLIAANASLANDVDDHFNPTVFARATVSLDAATMDSLATNATLPRKVVDALRTYGTNLRGSFPAAFYNLTKDAYASGSTPYSISDWFRMCPKDYFETGGHPLPSYQWFLYPDPSKDQHWHQVFKTASPLNGYQFFNISYTTNELFDPSGPNCTLKPIDGVPSGSPFWTLDTSPTAVPNWGTYGVDIRNFELDCAGQNSIDWARITKSLSGYGNKPTAGNVAPQLMVNQMGTRIAYNVYEQSGSDSTATLPPSMPVCDEQATPWLGFRSAGFVDAVELIMDADSPTKRLARNGKRIPKKVLGTIASSVAKLYLIDEPLYEGQAYSVAYATLGCTDCAQHNHAGAGTLFPSFQVQGSRPRYSDLVGTRDGKMVTGSCGQINDISLKKNPAGVAEGGKFMSAPLNSEQVCAVFSGTPCGNPTEGIPQMWQDKINGANFGQWTNQYNMPGPQMSFNGHDNLMFDVVGSEDSIKYLRPEFRDIISSQNTDFKSIDPVFSNKYSDADLFRDQVCSFDHANGLKFVKNPPCDPRHYDVDVAEGRFGCTNARVVGKNYHDYSVWPFVTASDPSGNLSSTDYSLLVPSGLFFSGSGGAPDSIMNESEFIAMVRAKKGSGNAYTAIRQLYPLVRTRNADGTITERFVSLQNMTGFDACQCFVGPNDADGNTGPPAEPYDPLSTVYPFSGCGFRTTWNFGRGRRNYINNTCVPENDLTVADGEYGTYFNCARKDGTGSCWSSSIPQSPGPLPQTPGWTQRDVENGTLRDGAGPRWWTESLAGIRSIRFGVWHYFAKVVPSFASRDIFIKKLYLADDATTKKTFTVGELDKWIEVSTLNISGYSDWAMFSVSPDTEREAYVPSETRDMCADFGHIQNQTDWSRYTLTDELFRAQMDPSMNVSFAPSQSTANTWDHIRTESVCIGNLHGMPSFAPSVCGPVPALENATTQDASARDVPCDFEPIQLPVCGNPYFNSDTPFSIRRPELPGNQFAHYCAPTTNDVGWYYTSKNEPDNLNLLSCEGDVLTVDQRQTFCAEGGFIGVRGERVAVKRPADSVCGSEESATCIAFAADPAWPLEQIIELADRKFTDTYTIVVVPVNATIMHNIPLGIEYEDLSIANRFLYTLGNVIDPPPGYPFGKEDAQLRQNPALASALCDGTTVNINAPTDDPLASLATLIDAMRMTEDGVCNQGPGLPALECPEGSYCVPMLKTVEGRGMSECVSEAEMFPPVNDASVTIDRQNVKLVPSAPFGRRIRFGIISGTPPATCTRITVKKPGFMTSSLEFDQTNCQALEESLRVAIVYEGQSATGSEITDIVVRGAPGAGVAYTGNREDGDAPYLTVGQDALSAGADAILNGLSFSFSVLKGSLPGIVAASARTLGTQIVTQCTGGGCSSIRTPRNRTCPLDPFCPRGACPYERTTQTCIDIPVECPGVCAYHLLSDGAIGCFTQRHATDEDFSLSMDRGVTVLRGEVSGACLENVYPFNLSRCDPNAAKQQWFVQYVAVTEMHRLNPSGRPYTCFVNVNDGDVSAIMPCDGCDASTEETIAACDSTQPFEDAVFDGAAGVPGTTFVRVAYSNETLGVAAFVNGSCALRDGRVWDDCRTECITVDRSVCASVDFVGGLLAACKHSGSLAAIQGTCSDDSGRAFPVNQDPPPIVLATAKCVDGLYVLVSHGLGYAAPGLGISSAASVATDPVRVWTSTVLVQPYDETMSISGNGGVSVFNLTALTGLFDRTFEARLAGADRATTWYLLAAVIAFALGIIISTVACFRLFASAS
jgi:hypothetical protein